MFTAIEERDGSFLFSLHRSPEALDPATARAALRSIEPLVARLRRLAAEPHSSGGVRTPHARRLEPRERARPRPRRNPATVGC